jgi:stage III sporulation protein AF
MVQGFLGWAVNVAAVALITAMFEMLLPSGNIKKFARVSLGLAMVIALLEPLTRALSSAKL